jgi:hypothetical protein
VALAGRSRPLAMQLVQDVGPGGRRRQQKRQQCSKRLGFACAAIQGTLRGARLALHVNPKISQDITKTGPAENAAAAMSQSQTTLGANGASINQKEGK